MNRSSSKPSVRPLGNHLGYNIYPIPGKKGVQIFAGKKCVNHFEPNVESAKAYIKELYKESTLANKLKQAEKEGKYAGNIKKRFYKNQK